MLSKEESLKTSMKDFFDSSDANKDGKYTREEWERCSEVHGRIGGTARSR